MLGVTVAVKATDWPTVDGLADEATTVLVVIWLTTCDIGDWVALGASFVSPEYAAVTV